MTHSSILNKFPRAAITASLIGLATAGVVEAATVTYPYYRFRAIALRGSQPLIQLSELDLYHTAAGTAPLIPATASDSTNSNSGDGLPAGAIDIGDYATKWLNYDYTTGYLIVGFNSPQAIDSYNFYTGNDATERDPVSWVLEGSTDVAGPWTIVDVVKNFTPTGARSALASTTSFPIPAIPAGFINSFIYEDAFQGTIIKNTSPISFFVDAQGTSITLSSSAGGAPVTVSGSSVTVTPPSNAYTTYTLTAHTTTGDDTKSIPVRTVPGATLSYRYVRFTPKKVAAGNTVGLYDLSFKKAGTRVPVVAVENPGGTSADPTPLANLVDDPSVNPASEYRSTLSPVILDFGAGAVSYDSFSFATGSQVNERPLQWLIEGSNDKTTWTLVENVNFDYNTIAVPGNDSGDIPFDGTAVMPFVSLASNTSVASSGAAVQLSYSVLGATSATLSPGGITLTGTGVYTIHPTATTTYTLTTTTANGTATTSLVQAVTATDASSFNYTNFEDSTLIRTNGNARILNDFANFTAAGNVKRLRLTDDLGGQHGSAWYLAKVPVKNGFETSYDAFIASLTTFYGADGMAFVVQNSADGLNAINGDIVHLPSNAVSVTLDGYPDYPGEPGWTSLEIWQADTMLVALDLQGLGLSHGGGYLLNYANPAADPYHMRVIYTPPATAGANGAMTVYVDSVKVIDAYPINLEAAGAFDTDGKAYVGFVARTGGFSEVHDVTAWSFTPAGSAAVTPLAITSHTFNTTTRSLTVNYSATVGKTYRLTTSTDLATWTQAAGTSNTVAASASGTFTLTYPAGTKGFFRVEQID